MLRFSMLLCIASVCWCVAPALAQAPLDPSAVELCKKADAAERSDCEHGLSEVAQVLGPDLWSQFVSCASTKDINKKEEVLTCLSDEMIKHAVEVQEAKAAGKPIPPPPPTSTPPSPDTPPKTPANGAFFTPEELCNSVTEKKDECTQELNKLKTVFGDLLWTEFAACAIKFDINKDNGKEVMQCISEPMMQTLMKKAEEEAKKMEEAMKQNPSAPPTSP